MGVGDYMNNEQKCENKTTDKLYRIGMFAQINRVTIKALRYYDDIDLLHPAHVDDENGYRYYTLGQSYILHKIITLKNMGLSIKEIKQVMDGMSEKQLFLSKKSKLLHEVANITKQIALIESYLNQDETDVSYSIVLKSLPEVLVASRRVHLESYASLMEEMPNMGRMMEEANCVCAFPEYCFTIYYEEDYKENDIEARICEAVTELKESNEDLEFIKFPEVKLAACVLHKGPYYNLPKVYHAVIKYIEENGYEIAGDQRESYIDGIWNKESEEDWLTEIQFPIRKL